MTPEIVQPAELWCICGGLNAISQFTAEFENDLHQGLGTGQLFHNNFYSPLEVENGMIRYRQDVEWDLGLLGIDG